MIHSFKGVDAIFCPIIEQTLYLLCVLKNDDTSNYYSDAYKQFSKSQRVVIAKFLELFKDKNWYSFDDEGEISDALNEVWYPSLI